MCFTGAPRHEVAHRIGTAPQTFGARPAHSGDCRGDQFYAEQIGHQFGQAILGQQLIVQQIDHECRDPRAVLHRCVDPVGKPRTRMRPAAGAPAVMSAMFGDDEGRRLGQIEDLAGTVASGHFQRHGRTAGRAGWRKVIDGLVGLGDLEQRFSFMAFLSARRPSRWLARTLDPRRLFEPVARRRFAAVGTVQSEPALKFGDMRLQSRNFGRLRRDQRNQLLPRWLGLRIRIIHRILESKPDSAVEKNLHAQIAEHAIDLGSNT